MIVKEDDLDVLVQAFNDEMDRMGKLTAVLASSVEEREVDESENAAEIAGRARLSAIWNSTSPALDS